MARNGRSGFEGLKSYYDAAERVCPRCGHADEDAEWLVEASGRRVRYERTCPSCGVVHTHVVDRG
jgi:uncharacterized Zn finger protein